MRPAGQRLVVPNIWEGCEAGQGMSRSPAQGLLVSIWVLLRCRRGWLATAALIKKCLLTQPPQGHGNPASPRFLWRKAKRDVALHVQGKESALQRGLGLLIPPFGVVVLLWSGCLVTEGACSVVSLACRREVCAILPQSGNRAAGKCSVCSRSSVGVVCQQVLSLLF